MDCKPGGAHYCIVLYLNYIAAHVKTSRNATHTCLGHLHDRKEKEVYQIGSSTLISNLALAVMHPMALQNLQATHLSTQSRRAGFAYQDAKF